MTPEAEFEGFRIEEVLSRSSTTTVYRAYQYSLKREVLIKELRPELFQEEDLRQRFEREAQVCAHIKNENIVDIYDFSASANRAYLVMEYVEGCSLDYILRDNPQPPLELAYSIMLQTLKGLAYAHSKGVVHRDLKPGNILISRDGWVKVTDFGLAQFEGAPQITQPGAVVGTPAYLSPEAISGGGITYRSDIFSLGVTFYQLLTGKKIFWAEHFSDSLNKVLSFHPSKPSQNRPDIPSEMDRIILRMLEKQPAKWWNSCGEILEELSQIAEVAQIDDPRLIIKRYWEEPPRREPCGDGILSQELEKSRKSRKPAIVWVSIFGILVIAIGLGIEFVPKGQAPVPLEHTYEDTAAAITKTDIPEQEVVEFPGDSIPGKLAEEPEVQKSAPPPQTRESQTRKEPQIRQEEIKPTSVVSTDSLLVQSSLALNADTVAVEPIAHLIPDTRPARLQILCDPWAEVYVDDILIGKTPLRFIQVEPGEHRLVFRHPTFAPIFRDVEAKPAENITLKINFWNTVGRIVILVDPWAEVYVDGDLIDVTPLKEPLIVSLGKHTVTLKNPLTDTWEKELTFRKGDPPCTLKVALKPANG